MQELQDRLVVRTFGAFSVSWNGILLFESSAGETQFTCLMQMLLHCCKEGVDRARLLEELFYDREVQDATHSMNVLFYNARRKLRQLGLPACSYMEKRNGKIFWTGEIPVREDAADFEELLREAADLPDEDSACLPLLLKAAESYLGEFLPNRASSLWVSHEAHRYRELFGDCVRRAALLLREQKDYARLEKLGRHASRVQPFYDWERLTLEALIAQGRAEEAKTLYRETEQRYFQELKLRPDKRMAELHSRIEALTPPDYKRLDNIQKQLADDKGLGEGACFCLYSTFECLYQAVQRRLPRSGGTASLMLCTLDRAAGQEEQNSDFRIALCGALRQSDVVCRYGQTQYLVLLMDTAPEACATVQARINARLSPAERAAVRYDVKPV